MDKKRYGGVGAKEVIVFQTKIMMGAQYERIVWAKNRLNRENKEDCQKEILVACLRMGWNDAFRHTLKNADDVNGKNGAIRQYKKNEKYQKELFVAYRGKIKTNAFNVNFDDYFSDLIASRGLVEIFKKYAKKTEKKSETITNNWENIKRCFQNVKKLEEDKTLSVGHIQKMFNIATKLYLCLYISREELDLCDDIFDSDIVECFENADCPIDSIVLGSLEQEEMKAKGEGAKYSSDKITWSQMDADTYEKLQEKIKEKSNSKSGLWFDFKNWN